MQNGVYSLPNAFVSEGKPEDLLTKQTNVSYDSDADCPLWESFFDDIFSGDETVKRYVQKALGLSLSGDMSEQAFFICYGDGANGKSTLLNTVRKVMGDYARTTSFQTFDADSRNEYGNDMADLTGCRFVTAIESEQNKKLAEARVKTITGGDDISCRFLYGQLFTYTPSYKVWLAVNHKPQVRGADHGIWRRLHLIPFNVRFGPSGSKPIDKDLEHKLAAEFPGIFNWLVKGYQLWKAEGLTKPKAIEEASLDYQSENDTVARWIAEECELGDYRVEAGEAYKAFREWIIAQGEAQRFVPNMTFWGHRMTEKAFQRGKNGKGRSEYRGFRVKPLDLGVKGN
jgi:putative DNA primase/helicase